MGIWCVVLFLPCCTISSHTVCGVEWCVVLSRLTMCGMLCCLHSAPQNGITLNAACVCSSCLVGNDVVRCYVAFALRCDSGVFVLSCHYSAQHHSHAMCGLFCLVERGGVV